MGFETFRTVLGCISAVLGVVLIVASSQRMYYEESQFVEQAIHKRNLMSMVTEGSCDNVDPAMVGRVIHLEGCKLSSSQEIESLQKLVTDPSGGDQPSVTIGAYTLCVAQGAAAVPAIKISPAKGAVRGEATKWESTQLILPEVCNSLSASTDTTAETPKQATAAVARTGQLSQDQSGMASIIAVQGTNGVLVPLKAVNPKHNLLILEPGVSSVATMSDNIQVKPVAPRELAVLLIFAGCLAGVLGLAEIPAHSVPGPVKVPVFQTCTLTLMATLSFMITGIVCGVIFGVAWSQYHIFLAIPMFAGAFTSFLLLLFLRFRCAYDGTDDDDDY